MMRKRTSQLEIINSIQDFILTGDSFLLSTHQKPDGDALGSSLALARILEGLDKKCSILLDDSVSSFYRFLPGVEKIEEFTSAAEIDPTTRVIVPDAGNLERIGDVSSIFTPKNKILNIDHHPDNTHFGHLNWVEAEAAATGELIFILIDELELKIDEELATLLATTIITDTGSFRFDNTRPFTHRMMATLLEKGAESTTIIKEIYQSYEFHQLKLLSLALDSMERSSDGSLAWCTIDREMMNKTGISPEEITGVVNYPRSVNGVRAGVLFKELEEGKVRVSLRSNGSLPVNRVAARFGGGGHEMAAGCIMEMELGAAKRELLTALEGEMRNN